MSYLFRSLGAIVGVSVGGTLVQGSLRSLLYRRLAGEDVDIDEVSSTASDPFPSPNYRANIFIIPLYRSLTSYALRSQPSISSNQRSVRSFGDRMRKPCRPRSISRSHSPSRGSFATSSLRKNIWEESRLCRAGRPQIPELQNTIITNLFSLTFFLEAFFKLKIIVTRVYFKLYCKGCSSCCEHCSASW